MFGGTQSQQTFTRCTLANNPVSTSNTAINVDQVKRTLQTITSVATTIEQLLAAAGVQGGFNGAQAERLTTVLGNLAAIAVQAVHDAAGKEITPASVMALMPVATPLQAPAEIA
jgi:phenylalanyl-tRNA synthetase beta subunit